MRIIFWLKTVLPSAKVLSVLYRQQNRFHRISPQPLGLRTWCSAKESICQCRRRGFSPWVGQIPWRKKWQPLQYSCQWNSMDRGAWQATVHGVAGLDTTEYTHTHTHTHTQFRPWWKCRSYPISKNMCGCGMGSPVIDVRGFSDQSLILKELIVFSQEMYSKFLLNICNKGGLYLRGPLGTLELLFVQRALSETAKAVFAHSGSRVCMKCGPLM